LEKNTRERREGDKGTKEIKRRKKEVKDEDTKEIIQFQRALYTSNNTLNHMLFDLPLVTV
jgi:hypothetical protein